MRVEPEEGKVKAVLRYGYKLNDTLLRPAKAVVSNGNEEVSLSETKNVTKEHKKEGGIRNG